MVSINENEDAKIFAENLTYYMKLHKVDRVMLANELNFKYTTVCDWCNGKVIPRANKILILANYFGIQKSDLTKKDELLTNKNINRKREILIELPTLYGNPDSYFGYIIFDDISNYGKHVFPGDTIVLKKDNKITKKDTFYLIKLSKGKPILAYLTESENDYIFLPTITYSKTNNKPITCPKDNLSVEVIGVAKYVTRDI